MGLGHCFFISIIWLVPLLFWFFIFAVFYIYVLIPGLDIILIRPILHTIWLCLLFELLFLRFVEFKFRLAFYIVVIHVVAYLFGVFANLSYFFPFFIFYWFYSALIWGCYCFFCIIFFLSFVIYFFVFFLVFYVVS